MTEVTTARERAESLYREGRLEAALAEYRRLLAGRPDDADLLNKIREVLRSLGKTTEDVDLLPTSQQTAPEREATPGDRQEFVDEMDVPESPPGARCSGRETTGSAESEKHAAPGAADPAGRPLDGRHPAILRPFRAEKRPDISETVRKHLCNACGACAGICPRDAISHREDTAGHLFPEVDRARCNGCGACLRICQGANLVSENRLASLDNPFHGNIRSSFVGRATDHGVYAHSQSGGLVTALSLCALEEDDVGGVLVVSMPPGNPPRPRVKIARTAEEVRAAQKSKYCPVPLLQALNQVKDIPGKVVVVGLPCHLHALLNFVAELPEYEGKVKYRLGLVCELVMTYGALDYLTTRAGLERRQRVCFIYKDKLRTGYPGDVSVRGDHTVIWPAELRISMKDMFTPIRCRLCFDKMNVFSDVTIGDPHGIEGCDRRLGESVALVRTDAGQSLVETAVRRERVKLRTVPPEGVLRGQKIDSRKVLIWSGYLRAWSEMGGEVPAALRKLPVKPVETTNCRMHLQQALALKRTADRDEIFRLARERFSRFKPTSKRKRKQRLTVEIRGVGFVNKGAELMLQSVLQHYAGHDVRFAMEPLGPYGNRAKLGLLQKLTVNGEHITISSATLRKLYGLVPDEEVDAVLDASGFCYSEQFGPVKSELMAHSVQRWKRQGTKVILLPQAFGPFESERLRTAATIIVENADLLFARDEVSLEHLRSLGVSMENVYRAPDFTCLMEGVVPESFRARTDGLFCVIPNIRIYEKLPQETSRRYMPLLKQSVEAARRRGLSPFILIHEAGHDADIGLALRKELGDKIEIVREDDPLKIKGVIGKCKAVLSSRYHGLVSAMSQGVPSLGTGWSHKYRMLFEQYGCPECLLDLRDGEVETREEKMETVLDPQLRAALRARLLDRAEEQEKLTISMWERVDAAILPPGGDATRAEERGERHLRKDKRSQRAARIEMAGSCHARGEHEEAQRILTELLEQHPEDAEAQNDMGVVLYSMGRVEQSIDHFLSAWRLGPRRADTRANLEGLLQDPRLAEAQKRRIRNLLRMASEK